MATDQLPGDVPVSLNEARSWLRMGTGTDDAVVAQLLRAATSICEAYVGQWLIVRRAEETSDLGRGAVRLSARPVVTVEAVTLLSPDDDETELTTSDYRLTIEPDGAARLTVAFPGDNVRVRVSYRAGMSEGVNGVPEAIRQGIVRMIQYLHDARDSGRDTPPAVIAALWQPWRRLHLGGGR